MFWRLCGMFWASSLVLTHHIQNIRKHNFFNSCRCGHIHIAYNVLSRLSGFRCKCSWFVELYESLCVYGSYFFQSKIWPFATANLHHESEGLGCSGTSSGVSLPLLVYKLSNIFTQIDYSTQWNSTWPEFHRRRDDALHIFEFFGGWRWKLCHFILVLRSSCSSWFATGNSVSIHFNGPLSICLVYTDCSATYLVHHDELSCSRYSSIVYVTCLHTSDLTCFRSGHVQDQRYRIGGCADIGAIA